MDIYDFDGGETISLAELDRIRWSEWYSSQLDVFGNIEDWLDLLLAGLEADEKEGN